MGHLCSRDGVFRASRARAQVLVEKGPEKGREEHQSNQLTQTPSPTASPARQGPDQGCGAEDAGALLPALSSPSHRGVSVSPWGSVSNAAEHCARLPAAVWRGATACLFPGCRPALLLNASGFLAVMVVLLSN